MSLPLETANPGKIVLLPARGRDYRSKKAAVAAFDAGEQFLVQPGRTSGPVFVSRSALSRDGRYSHAEIRYADLARSVVVPVPPWTRPTPMYPFDPVAVELRGPYGTWDLMDPLERASMDISGDQTFGFGFAPYPGKGEEENPARETKAERIQRETEVWLQEWYKAWDGGPEPPLSERLRYHAWQTARAVEFERDGWSEDWRQFLPMRLRQPRRRRKRKRRRT